MKKEIVIHWFRQDLRLKDNPALHEAALSGTVLPIYIMDDKNPKEHALGRASKVWLHHSLSSLDADLNNSLSFFQGDPLKIIEKLCQEYCVKGVYWNRCYEPFAIQRDKKIKEALKKSDVDVQSFNGSLLWEPWEIHKEDGTPYKVFSPFYRKGCLNATSPRDPWDKPRALELAKKAKESISIEELKLLPKINWNQSIEKQWDMSEKGAHQRLKTFLQKGIFDYKKGRDFPAMKCVSTLSPYLHFGQVSPNQAWYGAQNLGKNSNIEHFCSELGWREFSYHLLYHHPHLPTRNLQPKFDRFPWKKSQKNLQAWEKGMTGIPMVDAGMRELWQTGYMHNRVRMIVGSFLVKNLLIHWHCGEEWFWDCLVDADLANNSASWQWVAGCGADAAPYFRIFNPVTQGQKFDPQGEYIRHYIPELAQLSERYLYSPWEAPESDLRQAGIVLGQDYPHPIVDLKESRQEALNAFQTLKEDT